LRKTATVCSGVVDAEIVYLWLRKPPPLHDGSNEYMVRTLSLDDSVIHNTYTNRVIQWLVHQPLYDLQPLRVRQQSRRWSLQMLNRLHQLSYCHHCPYHMSTAHGANQAGMKCIDSHGIVHKARLCVPGRGDVLEDGWSLRNRVLDAAGCNKGRLVVSKCTCKSRAFDRAASSVPTLVPTQGSTSAHSD